MIDFNSPDTVNTAGADLAASSSALVARMADTTIDTVDAAASAVAERQQIADAIKAVEAFFAPIKKLAFQLHKTICDRESAIVAPLRCLDAKKRIALAEFKRREDDARRAEEQAQAERDKREREQRAITDAARIEQAGDQQLAFDIVNDELIAPAPVVVLPDRLKAIKDLKFRKVWRWRYANNDPAAAMKAIPLAYLMADEKKISAYAAAMKESANIPGIEFYVEQVPIR